MSLRKTLVALALLGLSAASVRADQVDDFFAAARKGDAKTVEELLAKGVDVNSKYRYGQTALFFAADRGYLEVAKVLVAHGVDMNVKDTFYHTTALEWCVQNDHPDVAKFLLEKGATGKDEVLGYAVDKNHPELVRAILDMGGVPVAKLTVPLRTAKKNKLADIVEMLTKAGAVDTPPFAVDEATLKSYAGDYKPAATGLPEMSLALKDGKLVGGPAGQNLTLRAKEKAVFELEEAAGIVITFVVADGKVTGLTLQQGGGTFKYNKAEAK